MPEKTESLETKILGWLSTHGYPFEMRVATAFQKAGFKVLQSDFFLDAAGKPHEIDIIASIDETYQTVRLRVTFIIECKRAKDKPWILLSGNQKIAGPQTRLKVQPASQLGHGMLAASAKDAAIQSLELFNCGGHFSFGLLQAFSDKGNLPAHEAITSLSGALGYRIAKADRASGLGGCCEIFIPILATEGRLFECSLDGDSRRLELEEIKSGTLILRKPLLSFPMTIIDVVTESELDDYIETAYDSSQKLLIKMASFIKHTTAAVAPETEVDLEKNGLLRTLHRMKIRKLLVGKGLVPPKLQT